MDKKTNILYSLMDKKYRENICTLDAMNALNSCDFLMNIDLYYNFWSITKCKDYIEFVIKNASEDMNKIVDIMYFKDDSVNRKPRYEIYKEILLDHT